MTANWVQTIQGISSAKDLPSIEKRKSIYRELTDFECWDTLFQLINLAIESGNAKLEDFFARAEVEYEDFGDLNAFKTTCEQATKELNLRFSDTHTHLIIRILGQAKWREEAIVLNEIWRSFSSKSCKISCLERLCLLYEKKIFQEDKLKRAYQNLFDLAPRNIKALKYFKLISIQEQKWGTVVEHLSTLIETSQYKEDVFRSALELAAVQLYQLDDPKQAIVTIEKHCKGGHLDSSTIHLEAYQRMGDGVGCLKVLDTLLGKNVEKGVQAVILFRMGEIHEALDRMDLAVDCYRKSLSIAPQLLEANERMIKILMRRGKWEDALRALGQFGIGLSDLGLRTKLEMKISEFKKALEVASE